MLKSMKCIGNGANELPISMDCSSSDNSAFALDLRHLMAKDPMLPNGQVAIFHAIKPIGCVADMIPHSASKIKRIIFLLSISG